MSELRENLGRVGLWSMQLRSAGRPQVREAVAELDDLGWRAIWMPGLDGAGALDDVGRLLAAAPHSTVVTGVLNIWGQSAAELGAGVAAFDAAYGPRTVIGLGVGNRAGAAARGQHYGDPVDSMSRYLDELGAAVPAGRLLLGALGRRMADLAAARTAGWHPFLVTPEYVAAQRARVGATPFLAPHQAVVLESDPAVARETARAGIGAFIGFPAYRANLRRLGFTDDDLVPGGSDRLIDALVAHGSADDVVRRVREHLGAGADHVALHVIDTPGSSGLPLAQWRELAFLAR
ncbi:TIGR03620 family F420-dependent LLM class oxidoreductase [Actinacidiphila acidipaludis]|uniref:TIGR03620 family F420-dependent LLM class oxidoreductase n=1 Tax=Actinacidiphila acidipaludis TaxID=2873382 RepID=A0ABS7PYP6_9ACTN|nr:TIGR03620 family F420-dependent LLM class oxidoreductase [Streptomyces acidipaludis]MBY8876026.1 TIGR03620 family F420-dependent LLM class oxidoreductase [Streptomyces acidipaludis]